MNSAGVSTVSRRTLLGAGWMRCSSESKENAVDRHDDFAVEDKCRDRTLIAASTSSGK